MTIIRVSLVDQADLIPFASAPADTWALVGRNLLATTMHLVEPGLLHDKIKAVLSLSDSNRPPAHLRLEQHELLVLYSMICSGLAHIACEGAFEVHDAALDANSERRNPMGPVDSESLTLLRAYLNMSTTFHDLMFVGHPVVFAEIRQPLLSLVSNQ